MNPELTSLVAAWSKIRPLLSSIPANLKAEILLIDTHLESLREQSVPMVEKVESEVKTLVSEAETFVERVAGKVISKVKGT